jgi:D-tyrosyl-tRNA(Tyr) deacylase
MKFVIQRVNHASVTIDGNTVGSIGKGLMILFGASKTDTVEMLQKYTDKIVKMRIFSDENDKTNLSLLDVHGELLIVSQFTLYADIKKGNRPSFFNAGDPDHANMLYEKFVSLCKEQVDKVETGQFGEHMKVQLENDGPFTVIMDSKDFE